ncbi:MAG: hypothetical protein ABR506_12525, partial [Candidatus Krumholzibacteriia bacterium]
ERERARREEATQVANIVVPAEIEITEQLPPLHELTKNVGIDLPQYLGRVKETEPAPPAAD